MYILLFVILYFVQPLDTVEQEKMAAYMVQINPKAVLIVRPLVKAIYQESAANSLDPTVLAAIAWNETWFYIETKGKDRERGVWQIWPWASPALDIAWEQLRIQKRIKSLPDMSWKRLRLEDRWKASIDIEIGTYLAASVIAKFRGWCLRKEHNRKRPTDTYAHYNTGYKRPRSGYSWLLWKRTRLFRKAIGRPEITEMERAFRSRIVYHK